MLGNNLHIQVVGLNFKTAPLNIRESVQKDLDSESFFAKIGQNKGFHGAVLLKTCNRIELYTHCDSGKQLDDVFSSYGVEEKMMYRKNDQDAIEHLFMVASSLDSMVIGEPQILGQVKQAYDYAKTYHFISPLLDKVFQQAFRVAKKIRNETKIGDYSISLSSIAVELTHEFFEDLGQKEVLIVGAGEMAEIAALQFQKKQVQNLWIMNRTYDHAVSLAKKTNGIPLFLEHLCEKVAEVDILLTSTGANELLLTSEQIKQYIADRKHRPLLCIDLSVPRNLDPSIHQIEDVYVYDIDDLQTVVDKHVEIRQSEALEAQALVKNELSHFVSMLHLPSISDTIQKIRDKVEPVCEQELRRIQTQLSLSKEQLEILKKSFVHFAEKLLLNPVMYIQETKNQEDRNLRIDEVRNVFLVDKEGS
ncbi:MAG: glutamyl-tRNA reductase [Bdellovibrionales bacterium]|nr:glutamyl-tRNA reductase [Bdellovibrionales bacterium]